MSFQQHKNIQPERPIYQNHYASFFANGKLKIDEVIETSANSILYRLTQEQRQNFRNRCGLDQLKRVVHGELKCFAMLRIEVAAMVGELGQPHIRQEPRERTDISYAKIGHINLLVTDQILQAI